jgi:hypothetical protein
MPQAAAINSEFKVSYTVANRPAGSDCLMSEWVKGADGVALSKIEHDNVASCSVNITRSTGFEKPQIPGLGLAGFKVEQCQWGVNPGMQCNLTGTFSIFTPQGQQ